MTNIEVNEIIKSIHEGADYHFDLGFEIRPSVNKVHYFQERIIRQNNND